LDETAGKIRVVSTTPVPLWSRVKPGSFSDVLYYRLNTVYVDVTA
jgi:transcriptional regulator of acetoin/glycerol metabolism